MVSRFCSGRGRIVVVVVVGNVVGVAGVVVGGVGVGVVGESDSGRLLVVGGGRDVSREAVVVGVGFGGGVFGGGRRGLPEVEDRVVSFHFRRVDGGEIPNKELGYSGDARALVFGWVLRPGWRKGGHSNG